MRVNTVAYSKKVPKLVSVSVSVTVTVSVSCHGVLRRFKSHCKKQFATTTNDTIRVLSTTVPTARSILSIGYHHGRSVINIDSTSQPQLRSLTAVCKVVCPFGTQVFTRVPEMFFK